MRLFRRPSSAPLWQDEFPVFTADERYVNRRQFTKFLTLTSFAMLAGQFLDPRAIAIPPIAFLSRAGRRRARRTPGGRRQALRLSRRRTIPASWCAPPPIPT